MSARKGVAPTGSGAPGAINLVRILDQQLHFGRLP